MRMSPRACRASSRGRLLAGGVEVAGHVFSEGVNLGVCHYAIHHNEEYYPDSFRYRPERWLLAAPGGGAGGGGGGGADKSLAHAAFCPFGVGPRGCVGKSMAVKELMITTGRVVWLYNARLCPGDENRSAGGDQKGYGRHRAGEYQL